MTAANISASTCNIAPCVLNFPQLVDNIASEGSNIAS